MRYSLRQLEVFIATCHRQTLSQAAESLAMSQSAASAALKELEQQFGLQLFDRRGKRLQLNQLGRSLRPQAEALLEQAQAFERSLSRQQGQGLLRVGATMTIGDYLAVDLMNAYMAEAEGGRCSLMVANTRDIVARVLNFDLDVGLIEGEVHEPDLRVREWRDDELVVFASTGPDSALESLTRRGASLPKALSDDEMGAVPWVLREPGSGTRQAFDRAMSGLVTEMNIVLELQQSEAIKRAVRAGMGLSCLSRLALQADFDAGTLQEIVIPGRSLWRKFYVISHRNKYLSPGLRRWLTICGLSEH